MGINTKKWTSLVLVFSLIFISFLAPVARAADSKRTEFLRKAIEIVPERSGRKIVSRSETGLMEDFITGAVTLNTLTTKNVKPSEVEDYNIYKGDKKITLVEYLRETGDYQKAAEVKQAMENRNKFLGRSIIGGLAASVGGFFLAANSDGKTTSTIGAVSMVGGLTWAGAALFDEKRTNADYFDYQRAIRKAEIYNSELRNELGLSK